MFVCFAENENEDVVCSVIGTLAFVSLKGHPLPVLCGVKNTGCVTVQSVNQSVNRSVSQWVGHALRMANRKVFQQRSFDKPFGFHDGRREFYDFRSASPKVAMGDFGKACMERKSFGRSRTAWWPLVPLMT